jgi:hypothetical protein
MDENHDFIDTRPNVFAPWRWHRRDYVILALISPLLYLCSVFMWEEFARENPEWRPVVSIINAPLEPFRKPFRRQAILSNMIGENCEMCGKVATFRFWERVSNNRQMRLRQFCEHHHREYLDSPADALKPDNALGDEISATR